MGRRTNKFSKAIRHIKSTEIDDKLAMLEAAPTNNTMGYMSTGVHGLPKPDITTNAFPTLPLPDFDQDDASQNGQDTSGLFNPDGVHAEGTKILVEEPPGDTSYILGPMAAMYYTWSYPWTMIGYIRESDRRMVNLARISGKLSDWDGVSNFNNSWWGGQLTLEQAVWFRDVKKYNNSGNDPANANYRAFYPGPPSNSPDAFGRYYCITTGQPKNRDVNVPDPGRTGPTPVEPSPDEILAAIMDRIRKRAKLSNREKEWLWDNDLGYLLPPDQRTDPRDDPANAEALDSFNKWAGGESRAEKLMNGLISALGKITKMESAANLLNMYDDFLKNPPADGQRLDATSQFSARDLNKLQSVRNQENINFAINKAIEIANDPERANRPVSTGVSNATTLGELQWELAGDQVTAYLQKMAHSTGGLDNSLHNNVQIDREAFRNSGGKDIVIIKDYQFRPGGSVAGAENTALGKTLMKGGVELDSVGSGNPLVMIGAVIAAKTGITGANQHGGLYNSPPMKYKVVVPTNSTKRTPNNRDVMNFKTLGMGYEPEGKVLSESRKSILKNIKKPVVLPKEPKKFKVKPKLRTSNKWMGSTPKISKPVDTPKEYKKIGGRNLWGKAEYNYNVTQSQERMNQVYELVGDGNMAFDYMLTDSKKLNDEQMEKFWGKNPDFYSYFYGGKKYKLVRKEQMDGDYLVFLVDDHGEKSNILQSELNEKLAEEQEMKELEEYNKMNPKEPVSVEKDYMFKKVQKRLKPQIDYKDKPAKMGYPNDPPPEMVNNRHPDFGKRPGTTAFNKLDPQSAAAMPQQDDETIDAKVKDAKENPKKDSAMFRRKLDDKMKKERERLNKEEWETSDWRKELEIT